MYQKIFVKQKCQQWNEKCHLENWKYIRHQQFKLKRVQLNGALLIRKYHFNLFIYAGFTCTLYYQLKSLLKLYDERALTSWNWKSNEMCVIECVFVCLHVCRAIIEDASAHSNSHTDKLKTKWVQKSVVIKQISLFA